MTAPPTKAEVALQLSPSREVVDHVFLIRQYEDLYFKRGRRQQARKGEKLVLEPRDNRELACLSQMLYEHYKKQRGQRYRTHLWLRRMVLHQQGRDNEVYDGSDAIEWCREAKLIGLIQ
jgi:hypothetical protein